MLLMAVLLEESITLKLPSLRVLTGIAVVALLSWKIFAAGGEKAASVLRKFFLLCFLLFFTFPYHFLASYIKRRLVIDYDLNYVLSQTFREMKGTDWADGILSASFFFIYVYMAISFWKKNALLDKKPPEDKPFKIEAKFGNIKNEEKQ